MILQTTLRASENWNLRVKRTQPVRNIEFETCQQKKGTHPIHTHHLNMEQTDKIDYSNCLTETYRAVHFIHVERLPSSYSSTRFRCTDDAHVIRSETSMSTNCNRRPAPVAPTSPLLPISILVSFIILIHPTLASVSSKHDLSCFVENLIMRPIYLFE